MPAFSEDDRANLSAYLDGELDEVSTQELEAKLSQDPQARAELDSLKRTWGLLDYLPKPAVSEDFTNRTIDRLEVEKKKPVSTAIMLKPTPKSAMRWAWAAALLLVLGASFGIGRRFSNPHEEAIVRHLGIIPHWREFEAVDDLDFLKALDHPDLFGDDSD